MGKELGEGMYGIVMAATRKTHSTQKGMNFAIKRILIPEITEDALQNYDDLSENE